MKTPYIATLCALTIAGCSSATRDFHPSEGAAKNTICNTQNLAGGWSQRKMDSESKEALIFVLKSVDLDPSLVKVTAIRSQVVNGTNYAIEFKDQYDQVFHGVVYRSLKGEMSLARPMQKGKLCP